MDWSESPAEASRDTVEKAIMLWRDVKARRLEQEKVAGKLKETEEKAKSFILECFKQQKLEGMLIAGRTTGLATKEIPSVYDKEMFMGYIKETGELELLQFRPAAGAINERKEEGIEVPGTEYVEIYDLFDRKV